MHPPIHLFTHSIRPLCRPCSFYDRDAPIYTMSRFLPPSKVQDAEVSNSILGDGSVIRAGCRINHSVIGLRTLISEGCTIDDALIMGSEGMITMLTAAALLMWAHVDRAAADRDVRESPPCAPPESSP